MNNKNNYQTYDDFIKSGGEKKWQKFWEEHKVNSCDLYDNTKKKFYNLVMFFYPSGAKIHIGHGYNYTGADVFGRYKRLRGFNVLEPMGYDAFGLPAENYALKTGIPPATSTRTNINYGKKQLQELGLMYDWEKEIDTSSSEYYKWTQWLFGVLYRAGLVYRSEAPVNWCPSCKTVLANEQVIGGKCERCESQVIQKNLVQWFFKITAYAEQLLEGHKKINWPEKTILMQKNWIGKSEGALIKFKVVKHANIDANKCEYHANDINMLEVFTTRPDTLFGATFMVVAPEHSLITNYELSAEGGSASGGQITNYEEVKKYINESKRKSDLERTDLAKEKTGVELKGIKAVNPVNGQEIPIFVADYVLPHYGTGAIMAVPAHDERDMEFAKKYGLPIVEVVKDIKALKHKNIKAKEECFTGEGIAIKSGEFDGLTTKEFKEKIIKWLEEKGLGKREINYRLRDWLISRQRYWGAPIPLIFCEECKKLAENPKSKTCPERSRGIQNPKFNRGELLNPGWVMVPEKDLPVKLPELENFKPTSDGESPLARSSEFVKAKCPKCGGEAKRSTETMDTFVCSSWYYLRYLSPHLSKAAFDKKLVAKWLPVDQYCGGAEHACMHLLYARFITKVLHNQGYINFDEPFLKLNHQGMILAADGDKMSKSRGNVVVPDDYLKEYGADVFRLYILFLAPFEQGGAWNDQGIIGIQRFLNRVWLLQKKVMKQEKEEKLEIKRNRTERLMHQTIKKVGEDIENFHFNTAISQLMILVNEMEKEPELQITHYSLLITILSPFAPHLAEELWQGLGHKKSIFYEKWPAYDPNLIKAEEIELVIQVNGKVREKMKVAADISESEATQAALKSEKIKKWLGGKEPKKIIFVPGKLANVVTQNI